MVCSQEADSNVSGIDKKVHGELIFLAEWPEYKGRQETTDSGILSKK